MKIGVLGGGQLGRMLALAGYPLGLEFVFYDQNPQACAGALGDLLVAEFDDYDSLTAFAQQVDLVTVEFENIPLAAMQHVARYAPVYPNPSAISAVQDRLQEKQMINSLGIPTAGFYAVDSAEALAEAMASHKAPLVVKSRRFGYDGKGQLLLESADDAARAWQALGEVPLIAEHRVDFQRELSIVAARNHGGEVKFYPLTENLHQQGILKRSKVSLDDGLPDDLQECAQDYAGRVMKELDYIGVLAVEFFHCDGDLVANEIAPRVHNSGHWSIEGAATSQFENHLRAILDWPLGDTSLRASCVMFNIIGEKPDVDLLLRIPKAHLHDYGKTPRPGRKLGHVTLWEPGEQSVLALADMLS